jgi:hypothetical protein
MTCRECGFLALGESELSTPSRECLSDKRNAEQPPLNMLCCTKRIWSKPLDRDELFEVIQAKRRPCVGFLRYIPGRSPRDHRDLEDQKRTRREKIIDGLIGAAFGAVLTLLATWLVKHPQLK